MQLVAGTVSPLRTVPASIPRPEYVGKDAPAPYRGPEVKDAETIERMREAGRLAARALVEVSKHIAPGVTTNFPKSLCTSVNEVICHGIPDSRELRDGDIVNVDITAFLNGVHGDTDATYPVGEIDEDSALLLERTHEAMMRGIKAVKPGRAVNIVGRVIESYAARFGYGVVKEFTGHGIGTAFHSGLIIPHYDAEQYDTIIEPGMTFTVEPMLTLGSAAWEMWDDGWTVLTLDRSRSAQFEHTVLVTDTGTEILTLP
jgi:methionyl aminopeptidase